MVLIIEVSLFLSAHNSRFDCDPILTMIYMTIILRPTPLQYNIDSIIGE